MSACSLALLAVTAARPAYIAPLVAGTDQQLASLEGLIMREDVSRYTRVRGKARKLDDLNGSVETTNGLDTFALLTRNGEPVGTKMKLPGALSFGEFSSLLRVSREALNSGCATLTPVPGSSPPEVLARFHYSADSARWFIAVDDQVHWLDFDGEVRLSAETGAALSISWIADGAVRGTDIRQVRRTVNFAPAQAGGVTVVLPQSAEYRVVHAGDRVEWNTMRFTDPARYGSQTTVKYAE